MKFSLTITDASASELLQILSLAPAMPGVVVASHTGVSAVDDENGPVNTNAPAVDSSGLPWDERIHAKNRGQNSDGTWRKRRGVDDATFAAVEAQLKAMHSAPVMPTMPQVAAVAPAPVMPTMPAAPATIDGTTFMTAISQTMSKRDATGAPIIDALYLQNVTREIGTAFNVQLNAITDILADQAKINYAVGAMQRDGKWNV